tara:strand:+ start:12234 stop:12395 length:162 start_codon:yes stop_codon:yes gene_type:complete
MKFFYDAMVVILGAIVIAPVTVILGIIHMWHVATLFPSKLFEVSDKIWDEQEL